MRRLPNESFLNISMSDVHLSGVSLWNEIWIPSYLPVFETLWICMHLRHAIIIMYVKRLMRKSKENIHYHPRHRERGNVRRWKWGLAKRRLTNVFRWNKLFSFRNAANVKISPDTRETELCHPVMNTICEFFPHFTQLFIFNLQLQNNCLLCYTEDFWPLLKIAVYSS